MLLGVDVGGTFTDAVLAFDGRLLTAKAPTTPHDQSEGVIAAVRSVLERAGRETHEIESFSHGMTVATNALLEGKGARTALIATDGFTDLIELGRQNRPDLYRLCAARPEPLVAPELRFGARERMTPEGVLDPLTREATGSLADQVRDAGVEAVAVALLHSYSHPQHELMIRRALPDDIHVSLSHEVVGTFREYERAATTEVDAALSPLLASYLRRLADRCQSSAIPPPAIMQSNGGLIDLEAAAAHAAWTVLSGPAGGAAGAAHIAKLTGAPNALCFDMGGTSCDVCVVDDGEVQEQSSGAIAGRPLGLPMLAVHTVGAGGGSIGWRDPGGALRVGPQSAGADPGPACYGRGGTDPTVTDANLLLGRLDPGTPLAGGIRLDRDAAHDAISRLARQLRLDPDETAQGIIRVANAEMVRALRVVTVERGIDPRRYTLLAFGGAGPLHAAAIAEELAIDEVICPRASGVLAALGLVVSPRRRDVQQTVMLAGDELTHDAVGAIVEELAERAREALGAPDAHIESTYELRYLGQAFELAVKAEIDGLRDAFEAVHEQRYGYRDPDGELQLVTVRVTASAGGADVELKQAADAGRELEPDSTVPLPESTVFVPEGWSAHIDNLGAVRMTREGR